ncbi:MAG: porin family protein [Hyphomicrobiales bacterium]|nr:porin family protein [Hyphomicrobiales bacterium]MCP4997786.1 porin family protein [Hyphomicrobiales bacterium]
MKIFIGALVAVMPFLVSAIPANAFDLTGFYVGGHAGYGQSGYEVGPFCTGGVPGPFDCTGSFPDPDGGAFLGGVTGGFNFNLHQFNDTMAVIAGIEADVGYFNMSAEDRNPQNVGFVDYGLYSDITARMGIAYQNALFYAKGGVAFANIRNSGGDLDGGNVDTSDWTDLDDMRTGYTVGGGAEYAFGDRYSLGVEYLYMNFNMQTSTNGDGNIYEHKNDLHQVKAVLRIKLSNPGGDS